MAWQRLARALNQRASTERDARANDVRAQTFDTSRAFTWTAWRDEVSGPDRTTSMRHALRGRLAPLLG